MQKTTFSSFNFYKKQLNFQSKSFSVQNIAFYVLNYGTKLHDNQIINVDK